MSLSITRRFVLSLLAAVMLQGIACRNNGTTEETYQTFAPKAIPGSTVAVTDSMQTQSDTVLILNTSDYHADEVISSAARLIWIGLFRNAAGYYLDTTRLNKETVYDPVLDEAEDGNHTGIRISTPHKDTAVILISGISYLKTGKVMHVPALSPEQQPFFVIQPGDSFRFDFAGKVYTLHVQARKTPIAGQPDAYQVSDYRLYLSGVKGGKMIRQLLTAQSEFDDAAIGIMFCGDMDGDQVPDFIINTSNHYNVFQPTLYLSSGAGADKLLLRVAKHTSVGC